MPTTDQLFEDPLEWGYFQDITWLFEPKEKPPEELRRIFEALPENVRNIAHSWGMADTVFRDEACTWLERNGGLP